MKLTKDQRFTAYCILIMEVNSYVGLCRAAWDNFDDTFNIGNELPELFKLKSGDYYSYGERNINGRYWFINNLERIEALEQCIAETAPNK